MIDERKSIVTALGKVQDQTLPHRHPNGWTLQQAFDVAWEYVWEGRRQSEIARRYRCDSSAISRFVRDFGLKRGSLQHGRMPPGSGDAERAVSVAASKGA